VQGAKEVTALAYNTAILPLAGEFAVLKMVA